MTECSIIGAFSNRDKGAASQLFKCVDAHRHLPFVETDRTNKMVSLAGIIKTPSKPALMALNLVRVLSSVLT